MLKPIEIADTRLRLMQHQHTHDHRTPLSLAGHTRRHVDSKNAVIRGHNFRLQWVMVVVGWGMLAVAGCGQRRPFDPQSLRRGERIDVSVVGVHDGDTLTGLMSDRERIKVRLEGIDAPELGQPFGKAAKRALSDRVFGEQVSILTTHRDPYGRVVGRVLRGERDTGVEMVREGFAWHATQFSHDRQLAAAEAAARRARAGLWADGSPEPPWQFRKHRAEKSDQRAKTESSGWVRR